MKLGVMMLCYTGWVLGLASSAVLMEAEDVSWLLRGLLGFTAACLAGHVYVVGQQDTATKVRRLISHQICDGQAPVWLPVREQIEEVL